MNLIEYFTSRLGLRSGWTSNEISEKLFLRDIRKNKDYSYKDLDEISSRLAFYLTHDLGVQPKDRIMVQVEKSPEAFFLYIACLRTGAIYVPLNHAYRPEEVEYFLTDAKPKVFVSDSAADSTAHMMKNGINHGILNSCRFHSLTLNSMIQNMKQYPRYFPIFSAKENDIAAIIYTSGTTGRSKGAMLTHSNLYSNAEALVQVWGFTQEDRLLHTLPIFHVHGLFISLHCTLASGSSVYWLPKFDAQEVIENLSKVSVFMGVPTYYSRLLEEDRFSSENCRSVRLFVSGSAPLRPETFQAFEARSGQKIVERYGMSETGINSSNPLNGPRIPGTVGVALPGVDLRIDPNTGMIEVKGPHVFPGYWNQPEKAQIDFTKDEFFITGDLGSVDSNGYLKIIGRAKDLIISGGFNIYPKEIENILDSVPGVTESAVVGVPHSDFGEGVIAILVRDSGPQGKALVEEQLIKYIKEKVASFKAPKKIFFVESLPRNTMGKVQKNILREKFATAFSP